MDIWKYTKEGRTRYTLTEKELGEWAEKGNKEAKREIFRKEYGTAKSIGAKLEAIAKRLG